jgi:hypothetical protein
MSGLCLTRRGFVASGAVLAGMPSAAFAVAHGPVVGFHADAPWLDRSGRDRPFVPPNGASAFAADSESLMRLGHFL